MELDNLKKMYLIPPNCPVYPESYTNFYNDTSQLHPINPYKIETVQNKRDGRYYSKMTYNNFYKDWKQDATKWVSNKNNEFADANINISVKSNNVINNNENIKKYIETKNPKGFAVPLVTNGTNKLNIVYNPLCQQNTFNYTRYASQPINNKKWFANPLYASDISIETMEMKDKYMEDRMVIVENQMASILEDMYYLTDDTNTNI
jgi:hypothetical protein